MRSKNRIKILWIIAVVLVAFVFILPVYAQDEDDNEKKEKDPIDLKFGLEAGYSFGFQMKEESMLFEAGPQVQMIIDYKAASRIFYGFGIGYETYDTESFVPLFLSFKGFSKKKYEGGYLAFRMGYAIGWDNEFNKYDNYTYWGGLLFSTGIGRSFEVKDKYHVLINANYKHQFVRIDYETYESTTYTENINYNFITLRIGLMF